MATIKKTRDRKNPKAANSSAKKSRQQAGRKGAKTVAKKPSPKAARASRTYRRNIGESVSVSDRLNVIARDAAGTPFSESSTSSTAHGTLGSGVNLRTGTYHRSGESLSAPVSTELAEVRAGATIAAAMSEETSVLWTSTRIGQDGGAGDVRLEAPDRRQDVEVTHVDTTAARLLNRDGMIDSANQAIALASLDTLVRDALIRKGTRK